MDGFKDNGYVTVKGEFENLKTINQEERQSAYKRKTTTDEHNMHLVGYTYDRKGEKFYILKNTWGSNRGIDGSYYLSENYFRLRTIGYIGVMVPPVSVKWCHFERYCNYS